MLPPIGPPGFVTPLRLNRSTPAPADENFSSRALGAGINDALDQ